MKQALLSAVGLHLVDPDQGFVLRTDASDYAVGAVLEQVLDDGRHVPVAFWSRVLAEGQRRTWTPREKGAYGIIMALRKWAGYIALHPVTVLKVLPWVVVGAGGLGAGKTSGAGTRGVSLDVVIGGRTGHSDTNGGESSDNRSKIHADCGPAENPSL